MVLGWQMDFIIFTSLNNSMILWFSPNLWVPQRFFFWSLCYFSLFFIKRQGWMVGLTCCHSWSNSALQCFANLWKYHLICLWGVFQRSHLFFPSFPRNKSWRLLLTVSCPKSGRNRQIQRGWRTSCAGWKSFGSFGKKLLPGKVHYKIGLNFFNCTCRK